MLCTLHPPYLVCLTPCLTSPYLSSSHVTLRSLGLDTQIQVACSQHRFAQAPSDDVNRRPGYPPQQQQPQGRGFNRQGSYNQQQGFNQPPGFQRRGSFNQEQGYGGRPDPTHRQQDYGPRDAVPQPRKRRQFSVSTSTPLQCSHCGAATAS